MVERYKNIFHFYRGPSSRDEKSDASDTQVEDNFTKALINLLDPGNVNERVDKNKEWCKNILGAILEGSDGSKMISGLGEVYEVDLQEPLSKEEGAKNRRLDAVVTLTKGMVGIESKVDSGIDISQLRGEFQQLKLQKNGGTYLFLVAKKDAIYGSEAALNGLKQENGVDGGIRTISWERVYENLKVYDKKHLQGEKNSREKFLVSQFVEYLELNGMVDYFVKSDFDRMYDGDFRYAKNKLKNIMKQLMREKGFSGFKIYGEQGKDTGSIGSERAIWDALYEPDLYGSNNHKPNLKEAVHFTFDLDGKGLSISLAVQGKETPRHLIAGMDKDLFITALNNKLENPSQSWNNADSPLFVISYWVARNYSTTLGEDVFSTNIPIYRVCKKDGGPCKNGTSRHEETLSRRETKIKQMLKEIGESAGQYSYFRITLHLPKNSLLENDSLERQANFIYKNAEKLVSFYDDWKRWCSQFRDNCDID